MSLGDPIDGWEGDYSLAMLTDRGPAPQQHVTQQALLEMIKCLIGEELTERRREAVLAVVFRGMPTQEAYDGGGHSC